MPSVSSRLPGPRLRRRTLPLAAGREPHGPRTACAWTSPATGGMSDPATGSGAYTLKPASVAATLPARRLTIG